MTPLAALRRLAAPRAGSVALFGALRAAERGLLVVAGVGAVEGSAELALGAAAALLVVALAGGRARARFARALYAELVVGATRAVIESAEPAEGAERLLDDARRAQVALSEGLPACAGGVLAAIALLSSAASTGAARAAGLAAAALAAVAVLALVVSARHGGADREAERAARALTGRAATLASVAELVGASGRASPALAELRARARTWLAAAARTDSAPALAARAPLALAVVGVVALSRALGDPASALLLAGGALAAADAARGALELRRGAEAVVAHAVVMGRAPLPRGGGVPVPLAEAPIEARRMVVRVGGVEALPETDLSWRAGELLVVRGPTGAGKSTLLRALIGAVASAAGELTVAGVPLRSLDLVAWRAGVSYLPQQLALPRSVTLREALAALAIEPEPAALVRALVRLGVAPGEAAVALERRVEGLSTGQVRRALLAALVAEPRPLLVLDEPEAALDPASARLVAELLLDTARSRRVAVATHSELFAGSGARVVPLALGRAPGEPPTPATEGTPS